MQPGPLLLTLKDARAETLQFVDDPLFSASVIVELWDFVVLTVHYVIAHARFAANGNAG